VTDTKEVPAGLVGVNCAYCGEQADKFSSGVPNCWRCWDWNKLNGPAARYWSKRLDIALRLLEGRDVDPSELQGMNGVGSIDMHDLMSWNKWGIVSEVNTMFASLRALHAIYGGQILNNQEGVHLRDDLNEGVSGD
jgi:hypothetical protein